MTIAPSGPVAAPAVDLSRQFQRALAAFNGGDLRAAAEACDSMNESAPGHPDVLHLMAMVQRRRGRVRQAEKLFRDSLEANPNQPAVLSNLGNLLRSARRFDEAEDAFAAATRMQPNFANAWYNRGLVALSMHRPEDAIEYLEKARALGDKLNIALALCNAYRDAGDTDRAAALAESLATRNPGEVRAVVADARLRKRHDTEAALDALQSALGRTGDPAAIHYEIGLIHADAGAFDRAVDHFEAALAENPAMIEAHRSLNEIHWQREDDRFLDSFRNAIRRMPGNAALYHNLAAAHISAGEHEAAESVLEDALTHAGRDPHLVHGLAIQKLKRGRDEGAERLLMEVLDVDPDNVRFLIDSANVHIRAERYDFALELLDRAIEVQPMNQEVWAYRGVAWRLKGDERHDWLNDYDRLLKVCELPTPSGFADTGAFMEALADYLPTLHTATRQPLDQSVRNGTQTFKVLFDDPHPLVAALKSAVEAVLADYLASLPRDDAHPFHSRIGRDTRFTGNWSIILRSGGHHTNHVHPYGWLSCCNYIALPSVLSEGDDDRSGWIKFGETSMQLGDREQVARAIRPRPGHCVFFPSYFWHGTYAFESDEPRMTVPCDIDPV